MGKSVPSKFRIRGTNIHPCTQGAQYVNITLGNLVSIYRGDREPCIVNRGKAVEGTSRLGRGAGGPGLGTGDPGQQDTIQAQGRRGGDQPLSPSTESNSQLILDSLLEGIDDDLMFGDF